MIALFIGDLNGWLPCTALILKAFFGLMVIALSSIICSVFTVSQVWSSS